MMDDPRLIELQQLAESFRRGIWLLRMIAPITRGFGAICGLGAVITLPVPLMSSCYLFAAIGGYLLEWAARFFAEHYANIREQYLADIEHRRTQLSEIYDDII